MKYLLKSILILILFHSIVVKAQFYNGLQMEFGKSRVQYTEFIWSYFRYEKYDVYYDANGRELAEYTAKAANKKLSEIENFLDYSLEKRVIFVVYNKQSDFKQANFGLVNGNDQYNIGGVTKILDNKVMLYFDGNHQNFDKQITEAVAEVLFTEILYGGNFKDRVANSTLVSLPDWYVKGLISYISSNWNIEIENIVKDGITSERYKKFSKLNGKDAIYAGHSIWNYIGETYGKSVISNILYFTKINKNAESAFLNVIGLTTKELTPEWLNFYEEKFASEDTTRIIPKEKPILKRPRKARVYQQAKISPNGQYLAYSTNENGQYKVWLLDTKTHKIKRLIRRENKLEQLTDYTYPILAWHPKGEILSMMTEEKGHTVLTYYYLTTKKLESRIIFDFEKVVDYSFSGDGQKLVVSAVLRGQTDIFLYYLTSSSAEAITNDFADDFNPRFLNNSRQIIFSSNRVSDTLNLRDSVNQRVASTFDIFIYDIKSSSKVLTRISNTPYISEFSPYTLSKNQYSFLTDENGIVNRQIAKFDSTISYIDTSTHYRYFTRINPLTNYSRNILEQDINPKTEQMSEILYHSGRYYMYLDTLDSKTDTLSGKIQNTQFRNFATKKKMLEDSLQLADKQRQVVKQPVVVKQTTPVKTNVINPDSFEIDFNNYVFEIEKTPTPIKLSQFEDSVKHIMSADELEIPKPKIYQTSFYINQMVSQFDFGFLNTSYQTFTGDAVYFNPGGNMLFKVGVNDLFEDYKLTGAYRFSGNFDSNEYLISIENLKKRLDRQYIFHRQSFLAASDPMYLKVTSNELMTVYRYPFSQVSCVRNSTSLRIDREVPLSNSDNSLYAKNEYKMWFGFKTEYIFDNTISLGLNLYSGSRMKIWGEFYNQIDRKKSDLFVLGADFRSYIPIHRTFIWATRFATSTSFGNSRLIYYLGSVDNWSNLNPKVAVFDHSIRIDNSENYAFQALATNMRGFIQNVRNGNTFAVLNNELRLPIFRYLANRPISSDFINNFQVIGFFDIGSAWSGSGPKSRENAYNTEVLQNGPITLIIDKDRAPYVFGYGYGLRSRLFGYFVRCDWAWGVEKDVILPRIFYLSLCMDF